MLLLDICPAAHQARYLANCKDFPRFQRCDSWCLGTDIPCVWSAEMTYLNMWSLDNSKLRQSRIRHNSTNVHASIQSFRDVGNRSLLTEEAPSSAWKLGELDLKDMFLNVPDDQWPHSLTCTLNAIASYPYVWGRSLHCSAVATELFTCLRNGTNSGMVSLSRLLLCSALYFTNTLNERPTG